MKFKQIPKRDFETILDRLTRFEPAYIRYKRVYDDIISKYCFDIRLKELSFDDEIKLVNDIVSASTPYIDDFITPIIRSLEEQYFNLNELSYQYLSNSINLTSILNEIDFHPKLPKNIYWLKNINNESNLINERKNKHLLYPIEKDYIHYLYFSANKYK